MSQPHSLIHLSWCESCPANSGADYQTILSPEKAGLCLLFVVRTQTSLENLQLFMVTVS